MIAPVSISLSLFFSACIFLSDDTGKSHSFARLHHLIESINQPGGVLV